MSSSLVPGSAADPDRGALIRLQQNGRCPGCLVFYFLKWQSLSWETNTSSADWRVVVVEASSVNSTEWQKGFSPFASIIFCFCLSIILVWSKNSETTCQNGCMLQITWIGKCCSFCYYNFFFLPLMEESVWKYWDLLCSNRNPLESIKQNCHTCCKQIQTF